MREIFERRKESGEIGRRKCLVSIEWEYESVYKEEVRSRPLSLFPEILRAYEVCGVLFELIYQRVCTSRL